jgi:hypothetical protein
MPGQTPRAVEESTAEASACAAGPERDADVSDSHPLESCGR